MIYAVGFQRFHFPITASFKSKVKAYGIQPRPRQFSSSVYSLYLGAEGKSYWRGANELAWI